MLVRPLFAVMIRQGLLAQMMAGHRRKLSMSSYDTAELQIALDFLSEQEYAEAVPLLQKIAKIGNPKAQMQSRYVLSSCLGVTMDAQKAIDLCLQVAEQNIKEEHLSAIAYTNMAAIYDCGFPGIVCLLGRTQSRHPELHPLYSRPNPISGSK